MSADDQQPQDPSAQRPMAEETRGLFLVGMGLFFLLLAYVSQSLHFSRRVPVHSLAPRAWSMITCASIAFFLGLAYIALGSRAVPVLGRPKQPTALGWTLYIVAGGVGLAFSAWINQRLKT